MFTVEALARYEAVAHQCKFTIFDADCMAYGLVASGFIDLIIEADLKPYDYMAVAPVIEGSGGVISDWEDKEITLETGDQIMAAAILNYTKQRFRLLLRDSRLIVKLSPRHLICNYSAYFNFISC